MRAANNFLVGADPEFGLLDTNGYLQSVSLGQGKIGTDHNGRVVELRPDPARLASMVCSDLFRQLNRRELVPYRRYKWKAGGIAGGQSIGGHIHLDVPYTDRDRYLPALDRMALWFKRLELFPAGETAEREADGWGAYSQYRQHGTHLEYRTPPSWLYAPEAAHLALSAFKLAAVNPVQTLDALQSPDIAPVGKFRRFFEAFSASDDDAAELFPRLRARGGLEKFRGDPSLDLKAAWGIPAEPTQAEPATSEHHPDPVVYEGIAGWDDDWDGDPLTL